MVQSLSDDLRWRVVYLHLDGYSKKKISSYLYISRSTVNRILCLYRRWGCVKDPFKGTRGRRKIFHHNDMKVLKSLVNEKVDWYLDELVVEMERRSGKKVSVPTLWRALKFCGITRKKLCKAAMERNELLRSAFIAKIGESYFPEQLIFIDESSKDERSLSRAYGYSFINRRAEKKVVFVRGKRYTVLLALTQEGIVAIDVMEGSCSKMRFREFILSKVIPCMNRYPDPNSVLVLDNAMIHYDEEWISIVEGLGGHVLFLPPYSPDFNPIETAFSVIKAWLKRYRDFALNRDDPIYSILIACSHITPEMAKSFFNSSIYF
ncbi:11571_t:CDS:2, partial [Acaulospora morrowiae]